MPWFNRSICSDRMIDVAQVNLNNRTTMDYANHKPRVTKLGLTRAQSIATQRTTRGDDCTRDRILRRDRGVCRCAQCLQTGAVRPAHHVDHVVPLWAGGAESDSNRCSINRECHRLKTAAEARMRAMLAFDPAEWSTPCLLYVQAAMVNPMTYRGVLMLSLIHI